ncbi:hypothetical protein ACWCY1_25730 [Streptomyces goshikiensis]|uniref:hypothetical protein n=1 Tax=Streptomyces TaxID=1883 RepID=UPI00093C67CD|nr:MULTISPECIES: hypothetical protein [Streptomyces]OKI37343.1 hypothetical protein A6A28_32620 [Streptomyces sp. CB03578]
MKIQNSVRAALLTTALISGTVVPAFAADGGVAVSMADQAVATVQKATGTGDVAPGGTAGSVIAADRGLVTVTTPASAEGRVSVAASDGSAVTMALPAVVDAAGTTSAAGTTVYPNAAAHTDLATQATVDGGARALVTLKNADAPTTQRFDLGLPEGATLIADGAGGYDIVTSAGGAGAIARGHIDAPWAKDANGKAVPTSYKLDGHTLVQTIETGPDTAYPVVADPHYTWGIISGTVYFNKSETKVIALGGSVVSWLPHPAAEAGGRTLAGVAGYAVATDQCIKFKVNPGLAPLSPGMALAGSGIYGGSAGDGYCR